MYLYHIITLVGLGATLLIIVPVCLRVGQALARRDATSRETQSRTRRSAKEKMNRARQHEARREPFVMAVDQCKDLGPGELSDTELGNARRLIMEGTEDAVSLAATALNSCAKADIAAIFTPNVIGRLAGEADPKCWPLVAHALRALPPWLSLFNVDVATRLETCRESVWLDAGFMDHVYPNPACQQPYRVLLERHFPPGFVTSLGNEIRAGIAARRLNMNMYGSYYVYSFPYEVLTTISTDGCRVLAALWTQSRSTLPAPPFWEPYGEYLTLARITELSDESAAALSSAGRGILFGDLRSFPDTPGHLKLAKRLASQRHVVLGASTHLAPAIAEILNAVPISPPAKMREILYCDMSTDQGQARAAFSFIAGAVPNILQ